MRKRKREKRINEGRKERKKEREQEQCKKKKKKREQEGEEQRKQWDRDTHHSLTEFSVAFLDRSNMKRMATASLHTRGSMLANS